MLTCYNQVVDSHSWFPIKSHADGCRSTPSVNISLSPLQEEDRKLLVGFLEDVMTTLSLSHAPLDSLKASFVELGWEEAQTQCLLLMLVHIFVYMYFVMIWLSFSANPAYHELLLTVLWYGVVHTSALVRCTAARMFEVQKHTHQSTQWKWSWLCSIFKTSMYFLIQLSSARSSRISFLNYFCLKWVSDLFVVLLCFKWHTSAAAYRWHTWWEAPL